MELVNSFPTFLEPPTLLIIYSILASSFRAVIFKLFISPNATSSSNVTATTWFKTSN